MVTDNHILNQAIIRLISESCRKVSLRHLEKNIPGNIGAGRKNIRAAVKELVDAGALRYSFFFGSTWIETSFNRPVRISPSVVVKPYNMNYAAGPEDIVIEMIPGVSFGAGDHPTSRLSVQGIEYALKEKALISDFHGTKILDIGTGSGILAIAALKFGIETAIGTDTDPCALREARQNARINGVEDRLMLLPASESISDVFSLITANLRLPDIMDLFSLISCYAKTGAPVVLSGIHPEEISGVLARYTEKAFNLLKIYQEKNWSSLVLEKNP